MRRPLWVSQGILWPSSKKINLNKKNKEKENKGRG
jgi:hypothetical protein